MSLPFDRVVLTMEESRAELSVEQFLGLPLDRRIGYVLSRQIEFYLGRIAVPRRVALAGLQQRATVASS